MDIQKEELVYLNELQNHRGYRVYKLLLEGMFNAELANLRNVDREDFEYQQGLIDGIERCIIFIDAEIDDVKVNAEADKV